MFKSKRRRARKFWLQLLIKIILWLAGIFLIGVSVYAVLQSSGFDFQNWLTEKFSKKQVSLIQENKLSLTQKCRRLIDGIFVLLEASDKNKCPLALPLVGVMVDNMQDAQPLSGIDKASLVFEAVTEANITRFLAIFSITNLAGQTSQVSDRDFIIGPVRSARPYYLDWAHELGALYAHVGSSPEANKLIKAGVVKDLDQWFKSQYFWREAARPGPHDVYTSVELLKKAVEKEKFTQADFSSWLFKDDVAAAQRGEVSMIKVSYNSPYEVRWAYNKENNDYTRRQWGGEQKTAEGNLIKAKNIVVAWEPMKILDSVGRKSFGTIGTGKAVVFRDGQAVEGTWQKETQDVRMKFFDATGKEIEFNAGATWVEIVPAGYRVEY